RAVHPVEPEPEGEETGSGGEIERVRIAGAIPVEAIVEEVHLQSADEPQSRGVASERGAVVLKSERLAGRLRTLGEGSAIADPLRQRGKSGGQRDRYGTDSEGTHRPSSTSAAGWTSLPASRRIGETNACSIRRRSAMSPSSHTTVRGRPPSRRRCCAMTRRRVMAQQRLREGGLPRTVACDDRRSE